METAFSHILTTWGAPGAVIVLLTTLIGWLFKRFEDERKDMRFAHAEERREIRQQGAERQEQLATLAAESTAQNRATEQVLRELTGLLGRIEGQTRDRH